MTRTPYRKMPRRHERRRTIESNSIRRHPIHSRLHSLIWPPASNAQSSLKLGASNHINRIIGGCAFQLHAPCYTARKQHPLQTSLHPASSVQKVFALRSGLVLRAIHMKAPWTIALSPLRQKAARELRGDSLVRARPQPE
jgi:hypothetical protein